MILNKFFNPIIKMNHLLFSFYLVLGFLLSQFLNIHNYKVRGGERLMTWFKSFGIIDFEPSIRLTFILCIVLAVLIFLSLQFFLYYTSKIKTSSVLNIGLIITMIFCVLSQLIFSSVMRLTYELLFCFVVLTGIIISKVFLQGLNDDTINIAKYQELWDILKFVTPLCIGVPILMGGAGFITSFYQTEHEFIRMQLYRHIALAVYFELGALLLIILPIFRKILIVRDLL